MIETTKHLIKSAGFGQNPQHRVDISLTEAEAAGACVAKAYYEKDDVFLVCDAGECTIQSQFKLHLSLHLLTLFDPQVEVQRM